ncbi:MAG: sodium:proton antiporter [Bacteroidota bacterium]|nr:sodium:proton antiporter [Bacteroidota bacterium]
MDLLTIITVLIFISAAFSYFNQRFIKLPGTIGVMSISIVVSLIILIIGKISNRSTGLIITLAHSIDFSKLLLDVMLGFLLFATALHFDSKKLKELRRPVIVLSTIGVIVSASVFGILLYGITLLLHINLPLIYCFIFGALISPTDPIAVASILKKSRISPTFDTIISGESLFNDAVGLILFVVFLDVANQSDAGFSLGITLKLFAREVVGGTALGLITGYVGYRLIKSITDFQTIFLITISLVFFISLIANYIHASVPLSVVAAGLVIGNQNFGKEHPAQQYLSQVWQLFDAVLNTILFVMIGLQLVLLPFLNNYWMIGLLSIVVILIARIVSVSLPAFVMVRKLSFGNLFILTWAGLRGGISIAMALSPPPSHYREIILSCCYFIVIFSVIVQGLTLNKLVEKIENNKAV